MHTFNDVGTSSLVDKINNDDPEVEGIKSLILIDKNDEDRDIGINKNT